VARCCVKAPPTGGSVVGRREIPNLEWGMSFGEKVVKCDIWGNTVTSRGVQVWFVGGGGRYESG